MSSTIIAPNKARRFRFGFLEKTAINNKTTAQLNGEIQETNMKENMPYIGYQVKRLQDKRNIRKERFTMRRTF